MKNAAKSLNKDKNFKYYKGASTNEDRGYRTHGKFKPATGQKDSKSHGSQVGGSHKGLKQSKEVVKKHYEPVDAKLKAISSAMFNMRKPTNPDASQRAQLNG